MMYHHRANVLRVPEARKATVMDAPHGTQRHGIRSASVPLIAMSAAWLLATGCGAGSSSERIATQQITANDFSSGADETAPRMDPSAREEGATPPRVISAEEARGGERDVLMLVGRPADLRERSGSAGQTGSEDSGEPQGEGPGAGVPVEGAPADSGSKAIVVDEMVGQINGRPVYAAAFLSSLDDILRAEAIEMDREEWVQTASQLIQNQLLERIRDELLIAEFNADLTYEERVGLFSFIEQIQQGIIDRDLGSAARADERLRDQENVSLRGKAEEQFNREIVFEQLRREVTRKVQVSWRDIRRYYEQNIEIFQPPSTAKLRVLRVDPAERETVQDALASGADRAALFAESTTFRRAEGGLIEMQLGPEGLAAAEFFGPPELNEPATKLKIGRITQPIEFSGAIWWLWLEDIETPEAISLYEAQNRIEQAIRSEREQQERARYFQRLFGTSAMTEQQLGEMRDRLIQFAIDRYLGSEGRSDW